MLLVLILQGGGIVWWASTLQASLVWMNKQVEANSSFRELWPVGRWGSGSLPSDVRQDLRIEDLERRINKLEDANQARSRQSTLGAALDQIEALAVGRMYGVRSQAPTRPWIGSSGCAASPGAVAGGRDHGLAAPGTRRERWDY